MFKNFLICPITQQIFKNPVVAKDGHTYEKDAIIRWIKLNKKGISPITGEILIQSSEKLVKEMFIDNFLIKGIVDDYLEKNPGEKINQYVLKDEKREFLDILINKEYNKLLKITSFDFKNLDEQDYHAFITFITTCNDIQIINHVIDHIVNLEQIVNRNKKNKLIHLLCKKNVNPEIVNHVIQKGINLESANEYGYQPIHLACKYSSVDIVKLLINMKVDLNCASKSNWKPIHFACKYSSLNVVKCLVDAGVNLESKANNHWRPIHFACRYSTDELISYLINSDINLECKTTSNIRPLHLLCEVGSVTMVKLMLSKNINVTCKTDEGNTPLMLSLCHSPSLLIVEALIKKNSNLLLENNNKALPIDLAFCHCPYDIVKYITKCYINKGLINQVKDNLDELNENELISDYQRKEIKNLINEYNK